MRIDAATLFKQHRIKGIGAVIGVFYLVAPLIGFFGYAMTAITMYTVVLPYTRQYIPWLTFQLFALIGAILLATGMLLFYKFVYPSYYAFLMKQQYIHQNPMQEDMQTVKRELESTKLELNDIKTMLEKVQSAIEKQNKKEA
jgi:hypothetical protein